MWPCALRPLRGPLHPHSHQIPQQVAGSASQHKAREEGTQQGPPGPPPPLGLTDVGGGQRELPESLCWLEVPLKSFHPISSFLHMGKLRPKGPRSKPRIIQWICKFRCAPTVRQALCGELRVQGSGVKGHLLRLLALMVTERRSNPGVESAGSGIRALSGSVRGPPGSTVHPTVCAPSVAQSD